MKKNIAILTLVVVILILGFSFYWFSLRPTQIKKDCYKKTHLSYLSGLSQLGQSAKEIEESNYTNCLREKGL